MKYVRSTLAAVLAVALIGALLQRHHRRERVDRAVAAPPAVASKEGAERTSETSLASASQPPVRESARPRATEAAAEELWQAIPAGRFRDELARLTMPARRRALAKLVAVHPPREDYASLHVSREGGVFYVCIRPGGPGLPTAAGANASPAATLATSAVAAAASVPLASVPARHSRPGSVNVLYLDFGGMTITGTAWNNDTGAATTYVAKPYDTDGDATTFSDAEQAVIEEVWERVAEDYSPFDIDVTTERPATFTPRTAHALITSRTDANGAAMPYNTSGGIAYVEAFNDPDFVTYYSPALIYFDNIGATRPDHIAEATAHELGHNLGLSHDGQTNGTEYYSGHDANTSLSWAPIMGSGYDKNITQWSKGEYYLANNSEDDVAIIAAHTGYATDEAGGTTGTATALMATNNTVATNGVLSSAADLDVYSFTTTGGAVSFEVQGYVAPTHTHGGDADLKLELLDGSGNVLTASNPAGSTDASVSAILAAGTYGVRVSPIGVGTPTASPPSGYTSYGSIGQYTLTGTVQVAVTQTITFPAIAAHVYGDAPFALGATSSSGLTVSYTVVSGPATVSGPTLTITGAGDVTIRASQPGNGSYAAAPSIDRTFTVAKATLTATADDQTRNYGEPNPLLTIRYAGFVNGDDVSVLTFTPTAATTATTSSAAGGYPITLTGGTAANYALTLVNGTLTVVGADAAPTIGSIADQTILQGTTTGALGFTIGDDWTAPASLVVSAHSSNQALVPDAAIVLGGSGANRTVTITPVADANGRATIMLSVSDGTLNTRTSFDLTVTAPNPAPTNTAPTISAIADQTVNESGATGALAFTIGDAETNAAELAVTATSSNETLVPAAAFTLGGTGANRTLQIRPAAGQSGVATITVAVGDGLASTTVTFVLTVNARPTITAIANQAIKEDTATAVLHFTIDDAETAASALVVTKASSNAALVPVAGIDLGGSGANRTVKVTPAANASGSAKITLTVSDGRLSAGIAFVVTVSAVNDAPTLTVPADQVIAKNQASAALSFQVSDLETPAANLVVSAKASSTTLFPAANIVLGGSGTKRTVKVKPATNRTGTATITVTVRDGATSTSRTFKVTVANPPTIGRIASQTTNEDTATGPIAVKVADVDTAGTKLTLTGKSSNAALLPASGFIFSGSGANRTLRLKPAKNTSGTATVTLTVSDGALTASTSFKLTVKAINDAPTISAIADQIVTKSSSSAAIAFAVADVDTPVANLTVRATSSDAALVPLTGVVLAGSGANRTVTLTPAKNKTGTATVTLTVSDGAASASRSFALTVNAAPTITAIANQTILASTRTPSLAFTVADAETVASKLKVTASSSSPKLVPVSGIALGGTGAGRTVRVTPVKGHTGSAKITLTVSDGAATASRAFWVAVTSSASAARSGAAAALPAPAAPKIASGSTVPLDSDLPVILRQPGDATVLRGTRLGLTVGVSGKQLRYQWLRNGEPIAGATEATLTIPAAAATDAGTYAVDVSSAAGTVRSQAANLAVVSVRLDTMAVDTAKVVVRASLAVAGKSDQWTFDVLLPDGWSYRDGSRPGADAPAAGDRNLLEWSWTAAPHGAQTIVFGVNRPADEPLPARLEALLTVGQDGTSTSVPLEIPLDAAP